MLLEQYFVARLSSFIQTFVFAVDPKVNWSNWTKRTSRHKCDPAESGQTEWPTAHFLLFPFVFNDDHHDACNAPKRLCKWNACVLCCATPPGSYIPLSNMMGGINRNGTHKKRNRWKWEVSRTNFMIRWTPKTGQKLMVLFVVREQWAQCTCRLADGCKVVKSRHRFFHICPTIYQWVLWQFRRRFLHCHRLEKFSHKMARRMLASIVKKRKNGIPFFRVECRVFDENCLIAL